jgi:hypothetical protein
MPTYSLEIQATIIVPEGWTVVVENNTPICVFDGSKSVFNIFGEEKFCQVQHMEIQPQIEEEQPNTTLIEAIKLARIFYESSQSKTALVHGALSVTNLGKFLHLYQSERRDRICQPILESMNQHVIIDWHKKDDARRLMRQSLSRDLPRIIKAEIGDHPEVRQQHFKEASSMIVAVCAACADVF